MKEIDINIEGFNVNGICVGCLNYNRKMFYKDEVKDCFLILAEIDVPDGLSIQVCWECLAMVKHAMKFRQQISNSYEILSKYSKKNTFLNSPSDLTKYATTSFQISNVIDDIIKPESYLEKLKVNVKIEESNNRIEDKVDIINEEVKQEEDTDIEPSEAFPESFLDDFPSQDHDQDVSEDDMQLSQLKQVKEKKEVKKKEEKKRGRKKKKTQETQPVKNNELEQKKLRNPPDELVEVFTMTEAEMWVQRAADLASKEFATRKHKCDSCLMTFSSERLMNEHVSGKHNVKGDVCYQCDVCHSYFLTKEHVSAHRALHLAGYRCRACGRACAVRRLARQHARQHGDRRQAPCGDCGKVFSTRSKLSYHRTKHHKEQLQCDCCGKVFASKMTLKYHLKLQTQGKEEKPKEKLYIPCRGCPKVFHSKKSYQAHVVIHNGLTYPCPVCGKLFQWKRNLARHMRNHRERDAGNTHECRPCGKSFSSRECYINHMRLSKRHVPEDAYVHACNYCGKKFASKWCMVDHIDWDHLKRIKYQCSVCLKSFKTAKIMVNHMRNIHEGRKNMEPDGEHLCEVCGKSYKTVKRLKGHVWAMHTNRSTAKSFKCKLCPATFTWQTSIYKHVKMMHDSGKRSKQTRTLPPIKKQEPYADLDLGNRMQYFQQSAPTHAQPLPVALVHNIV